MLCAVKYRSTLLRDNGDMMNYISNDVKNDVDFLTKMKNSQLAYPYTYNAQLLEKLISLLENFISSKSRSARILIELRRKEKLMIKLHIQVLICRMNIQF